MGYLPTEDARWYTGRVTGPSTSMRFDFEDRLFDIPTIEPAMSWRERVLLSLFAHVAFGLLLIFGAQLPFVRDAAERRAERLAELEFDQLVLQQDRTPDQPTFIFVEPLVDIPAPEAPRQAPLSDFDREAQSLFQAEDSSNSLPNSEGNSPEFVEEEELSDGLDRVTSDGTEREPQAVQGTETVELADDRLAEALEPDPEDPGDASDLRPPLLTDRGTVPPDASTIPRPGTIVNQAVGRAVAGLDSLGRGQSFQNLRGRTDKYGDDIQFDSKGVDFGSWIRRFRAQIYRNWLIPYAAMSMSGHVVLTFNIHKGGELTELTVHRPSGVNAFTNSAFNAMSWSNPTYPLPPEYPDESAFFTVTFYFNELPPRP
ncbi:MAG TPA: hypothetical protein DIU48_00940 [Acidobacteria bacterium]|nr:hypothetical protein [Acidobacteriota bacterium]